MAELAEEGRLMDDVTTYDARVYRTNVRKGKSATSYHVRWRTGPRTWKSVFRNAAQADSFRSSLQAAARNGHNLCPYGEVNLWGISTI